MAIPNELSLFNSTSSPGSTAEISLNISLATSALPCTDWLPIPITTVIPAIYTVICVLGTLANALAVCVLAYASASRTTIANIFMLNLCVSDLLFLLSLPLWAIYYSKGYSWSFGWVACKICGALLNFNLYASIFFITSMSIDRYLAIVRPLRSQSARNPGRARLACILVWFLACACSAPTLYLRDTYHLEELGVEACVIFYHSNAWYLTLVLMKIIMGFLLPLLIISCCYCAIGRHFKPERPLTLSAVVLAFFICWFPFHCVSFLELLKSGGWVDGCWVDWTVNNLTPLTLCLGFSNSAINPVLYCFIGKHFRGRLGGLCKGLCACLKAQGDDHSQKRGSFSTRLSSFSRKLRVTHCSLHQNYTDETYHKKTNS
uniref:G-protein coupled receptors family 1 profile domain-containing protein n=1 Tax=Mola mola TaxID=94237 RepID=A0A3Q3WJF5_MOLML